MQILPTDSTKLGSRKHWFIKQAKLTKDAPQYIKENVMKTPLTLKLTLIVGLLTGYSVYAQTPSSALPAVPSPLMASLQNLQHKEAVKKMYSDDEVDLSTLNPILQSVVDRVLANEDQVEWVKPTFDTQQSSLRNEHIVYSMSGKVKNVQWGGDAIAKAGADFSTDRTSWQTGINVKTQAEIDTDVLAALRFAGQKAHDHTVNNNIKQYKERFLVLETRLSNVTSINDLYGILQDSQQLSLDYISFLMKEKQDNIDCAYNYQCGEVSVDPYGNRQVDMNYVAWERIDLRDLANARAATEGLKVAMNENRTRIDVQIGSPIAIVNDDDTAEVKSMSLSIASQAVSAELSIFASVSIDDLNQMHHDLVTSGNKVNANDPQTMNDLESNLRKGLAKFKKVINGTVNE